MFFFVCFSLGVFECLGFCGVGFEVFIEVCLFCVLFYF